MADEALTLSSGDLSAAVRPLGAELVSLRLRDHEIIWQAGPAWPRHSPLLFPVVGRLKGDTYRHAGRMFGLPKHGFARDMRFAAARLGLDRVRFTLADDPATRAAYPFRFRLTLTYTLHPDRLAVDYAVANTGDEPMPFSIGAHPALCWPIRADKTDHWVRFDADETAPVRRIEDGLLGPDRESPVRGRLLALDESLFAADALIFTRIASHGLEFGVGIEPCVRVAWEGFRHLGLWSRPGGDFLCVEPWHGYDSSPEDPDELAAKPGIIMLEPGDVSRFALMISPCAGLSR
ncbi:MAG: aldose 1-epimerase family protein [Alsobacter sp.]